MILESTLQGMTDDANDKKVRSELRQLRRDAGLSVDDISNRVQGISISNTLHLFYLKDSERWGPFKPI